MSGPCKENPERSTRPVRAQLARPGSVSPGRGVIRRGPRDGQPCLAHGATPGRPGYTGESGPRGLQQENPNGWTVRMRHNGRGCGRARVRAQPTPRPPRQAVESFQG
jgi:hypothetical protein